MIDLNNYQFSFEINDLPPILANDMYFAVPRKINKIKKDGTPYTRMMATTASTPALKNYQSTMKNLLDNLIPEEVRVKLYELFHRRTEKDYGIELHIQHEVPESKLWEFDVSNTVKSLEDCIVRRIGVDDKYTTSIHVEKRINSEVENWKVRVYYRVVEVQRLKGEYHEE